MGGFRIFDTAPGEFVPIDEPPEWIRVDGVWISPGERRPDPVSHKFFSSRYQETASDPAVAVTAAQLRALQANARHWIRYGGGATDADLARLLMRLEERIAAARSFRLRRTVE